MKKRNLLLTGLTAGLLCSSVWAGSIGVVNVQSIFSNSKSVKTEKAKLQSDFKTKHQKLVSERKKLQDLMKKYKRNKSVMNDSQKKKLQSEISDKQSELYKLSQKYSQQANQAQNKAMQKFLGELKDAAAKVAKEKHLALVLPNSSVIYSAKDQNITDAVEKQLSS